MGNSFRIKVLTAATVGSLAGTIYFFERYPPAAFGLLIVFVLCFMEWRASSFMK